MIDRKHVKNLIALFFGAVGGIWAIWQHEIMMKPYMEIRWNTTFQFFSGVVLHWGLSYDLTLLAVFACWVVTLCAVWFWD